MTTMTGVRHRVHAAGEHAVQSPTLPASTASGKTDKARKKKAGKNTGSARVEKTATATTAGVGGVVFGGVDTHCDTHTAAVSDPLGKALGSATFTADAAGYAELLAWMSQFGQISAIGVEGSGSFGAGLTIHLLHSGQVVVDVNRPNRRTRRARGKSDDIDAIEAARGVAAGLHTTPVKNHDGALEALRVTHVTRAGAVASRADTQRQLKSLIITAPEALRTHLAGRTDAQLIATCADLTPSTNTTDLTDPLTATSTALAALARRHQHLSAEITAHDRTIKALVLTLNANLINHYGVGPETAAQLLITAGHNPERMRSEASFAMLCGVAPLPASSGRTHRHRLNRGGDRRANRALHTIATTRLRGHPTTRAYYDRRIQEHLSPKDIKRCLKRYIARELYHTLTHPPTSTNTP